jgi:HSP20 family protein
VLTKKLKKCKGVIIMAGLIPFNRKRNDLMNIGFDDFSNMLDDFFTGSWPVQRSLAADTFKIDIQDNDTEYIIEAELPGVKKEDVEITLNEGRLNLSVKKEEVSEDKSKKFIHRERRYAQMSRSILLADSNDEGIQAKLEEGVLTIKVPKKEQVDTSKRIMIE